MHPGRPRPRARTAHRPAGRPRASRRIRRSRSAWSGEAAAGSRAWSPPDDRPEPGARYHRAWERRGPGGSPGLQNRWRRARRGAVGSTPTRSRHAPRWRSDVVEAGHPAAPTQRRARLGARPGATGRPSREHGRGGCGAIGRRRRTRATTDGWCLATGSRRARRRGRGPPRQLCRRAGDGAAGRHQRHGRHRPHEPGPGALAGDRGGRGHGPGDRATCSSSWTRPPVAAARAPGSPRTTSSR